MLFRSIDGVGGMASEQLRLLSAGDTVIAISFPPYATETLAIVNMARERALKIVAITDSALSPLALRVDVCFEIEEAQIQGIRSPTAALCLAVSLVVGLGQRLEGKGHAGAKGRAKRKASPL